MRTLPSAGAVLKRKHKSLLGSSRTSYFKEKKSTFHSVAYKRSQRVRFRRRYAGSVLRNWGKTLWRVIQVGSVAALFGVTGVKGYRFWQESSSIRVNEVVFQGDIPSLLRSSCPIKPGQNLVLMRPGLLEEEWLKKFSELKSLSIRRSMDRRVIVSGVFRTPFARLDKQPGEWGIDRENSVFPLNETKQARKNSIPWVQAVSEVDIQLLVLALLTWEKEVPAFYSLVKKIETDRMRDTTVDLIDGVKVNWGELDPGVVVARATKIIRLRELFEPQTTPAGLRFVSDERIVMDAGWKRKPSSKTTRAVQLR